MSRFYTNVSVRGDNIRTGTRMARELRDVLITTPSFISTNKSSEFHTMDGRSAEPSSRERCRTVDFILRHESVTGLTSMATPTTSISLLVTSFPKKLRRPVGSESRVHRYRNHGREWLPSCESKRACHHHHSDCSRPRVCFRTR